MNKKVTNKDIVLNYLFLLIPLVLFSCYKNGYLLYNKNLVTLLYVFKPLIMFVTSLILAFLIELIYSNIQKVSILKTMANSYLPLYGALFSLIVPVNIHPLLYIFLLIIILIISKLEFIKINPLAFGRILFIITSFIIGTYTYLNVYEENVLVSYDLWDILLGKSIGASGATSIFILTIIFFILITKNYYKKEIALSSFITFFLLDITLIIITKDLTKINLLIDSEIVFASILIIPLLTKSPYTKIGKLSYGIITSIIGFIISSLFLPKEGIYIACAISSLFIKYFDILEDKLPKRRLKLCK